MQKDKEPVKAENSSLCTDCGKTDSVLYLPNVIKYGKDKGKEISGWNDKVHPGEIICISCGRKRGITTF